jgi:hypothetical protein
MPAPFTIPSTIESQIAEAHTVELQNKLARAQSAYNLLSTYDPTGLGSMPSPISWTAPTGQVFQYDSGAGELQYMSTGYSSLSPAQKREFFQYLPKFITHCMKVYDDNFNL